MILALEATDNPGAGYGLSFENVESEPEEFYGFWRRNRKTLVTKIKSPQAEQRAATYINTKQK